MKAKNIFKYHKFTTLESETSVVFSYTLTGSLAFINTTDGCGAYYYGNRGIPTMYCEFDIDAQIPQSNEYDKTTRIKDIRVLFFRGYEITKTKVDFNRPILYIPYAIRFLDNNETIVCNSGLAAKYIHQMPQHKLSDFIAATYQTFCK